MASSSQPKKVFTDSPKPNNNQGTVLCPDCVYIKQSPNLINFKRRTLFSVLREQDTEPSLVLSLVLSPVLCLVFLYCFSYLTIKYCRRYKKSYVSK